LTYTDMGLGAGETYSYGVSALNVAGESPKSEEVGTIPASATGVAASIFDETFVWLLVGALATLTATVIVLMLHVSRLAREIRDPGRAELGEKSPVEEAEASEGREG